MKDMMCWTWSTYSWKRREIHRGFWVGKPERKRPLGRPRCTERI